MVSARPPRRRLPTTVPTPTMWRRTAPVTTVARSLASPAVEKSPRGLAAAVARVTTAIASARPKGHLPSRVVAFLTPDNYDTRR